MAEIIIGWRQQASSEVRAWSLDYSAEMDSGDVLASATTTLIDMLDGSSYTSGLSGSTTVAGNIATQTVTSLTPGRNYRLTFLANMGGSKRTASSVFLTVPF